MVTLRNDDRSLLYENKYWFDSDKGDSNYQKTLKVDVYRLRSQDELFDILLRHGYKPHYRLTRRSCEHDRTEMFRSEIPEDEVFKYKMKNEQSEVYSLFPPESKIDIKKNDFIKEDFIKEDEFKV